jgi:hypothetical protein
MDRFPDGAQHGTIYGTEWGILINTKNKILVRFRMIHRLSPVATLGTAMSDKQSLGMETESSIGTELQYDAHHILRKGNNNMC